MFLKATFIWQRVHVSDWDGACAKWHTECITCHNQRISHGSASHFWKSVENCRTALNYGPQGWSITTCLDPLYLAQNGACWDVPAHLSPRNLSVNVSNSTQASIHFQIDDLGYFTLFWHVTLLIAFKRCMCRLWFSVCEPCDELMQPRAAGKVSSCPLDSAEGSICR